MPAKNASSGGGVVGWAALAMPAAINKRACAECKMLRMGYLRYDFTS